MLAFKNQTVSKKLAYLNNFYMRFFWKVMSCFLMQSGGKPKIVLFKCYSELSKNTNGTRQAFKRCISIKLYLCGHCHLMAGTVSAWQHALCSIEVFSSIPV